MNFAPLALLRHNRRYRHDPSAEVFPSENPYQKSDTVRALYLAVEVLDQLDKATSKESETGSNQQ
jgi:hypothetical protein